MNPSDPRLPEMPQDLDTQLYNDLLEFLVFRNLAFPCVDVVWRSILAAGYTVVPIRSLVKTRDDG